MKKIQVLLFTFICSTNLFAQTSDSIVHRLMIIPYQEEYYLSDAEQDIMKQTSRPPAEYRDFFRNSLDLKITAALEKDVKCVDLLHDQDPGSLNYMMGFHSRAILKYDAPVNSTAISADSNEKISDEIKNQHVAPQYMNVKGDAKFMNLNFRDTAYLRSFMKTYNCDMILSLNQFEIKTNYNSCIDIANKIYKRELMIHYTLIDNNCKVLHGSYVSAWFPSNSNRDTEISEKVFPQIATALKNNLSTFISAENKKGHR